MVGEDLGTTNILLAVMAAVSVLQACALIAAGVMCLRMYREAMRTVRDIQERQIAPLTARVVHCRGGNFSATFAATTLKTSASFWCPSSWP